MISVNVVGTSRCSAASWTIWRSVSLETEREIYQYAGGEVVVTCPIEAGRPGTPA